MMEKFDRAKDLAGVGKLALFFFSIHPSPDFSSVVQRRIQSDVAYLYIRYIANVDSEYICPAMEERRCSGGRERVVVVARFQISCRLDVGRS